MSDERDDFSTLSPLPSIERKTSISSNRRIDDVMLSRKEEIQRRLSEKEDRLAEFQARKERENASLKAAREKQAKAKLEFIEKIKQKKEDKRKETIRKISERDKRAEEMLKEREKLAISGRTYAVHINERLKQVERFYIRRKNTSKSYNEIYIQKEDEDEDEEEEDTKSKTQIIENIKGNIAFKNCLSEIVSAPLTVVLEQLKQLQTKVQDLEETIDEKNDEIDELEETIVSWKTKSFCIIIGLSLFLYGSGLHSTMKMRHSSNEATKFLKTIPPYVINCMKSK